MDSNTSIFKDTVNGTEERVDSEIQTYFLIQWWKPRPWVHQDGDYKTQHRFDWTEDGDGVWFWTGLTQQGVNLLDLDRLDFAETVTHLTSGPANERTLWIRICPKEPSRALVGDAAWEQHFEIWNVDSDQDRIECRRNCEFGVGSIGSSTRDPRDTWDFLVQEQVRDEDVSIMKEKKRVNVATKPIFASVKQYCSNRKIGILQAMDSTLHYKMMVTSRWSIWHIVCKLWVCMLWQTCKRGTYVHRFVFNT